MAPLADAAPEESGYTSSMSTSLLTGLSIVVPTKFSSQDKSYNNLTSPTSTTTEAKYDAFLHYSNDQVRMNKLMFKDTTDSDGTTKNETEPQLQQQCTKLSNLPTAGNTSHGPRRSPVSKIASGAGRINALP